MISCQQNQSISCRYCNIRHYQNPAVNMRNRLATWTWLVWLINPLSRLIKMNFIDMRNFFNTAYSVSKNNRLFSDCIFLSVIQILNGLHLGSDHLGRDVCVNFIKTIFQILCNDVIDNINKFHLSILSRKLIELSRWL
jgi:hypothetical protein